MKATSKFYAVEATGNGEYVQCAPRPQHMAVRTYNYLIAEGLTANLIPAKKFNGWYLAARFPKHPICEFKTRNGRRVACFGRIKTR